MFQSILMTSGHGQHHSHEPDPKKPDKKITPYICITWPEIQALVDRPQQVEKSQAQWLIPSTHLSRNFKEQEQQGEFWMLWVDLDNDPKDPDYSPPTLHILEAFVKYLLDDCDYEIYNSRSATVNMQKARILVPLSKPLNGADWMLAQTILNDKLIELGITPDRATERPAQLCYLPNKGAFYGSRSKRDGACFDPLAVWQAEITTHRDQLAAQHKEIETAKAAAKARREILKPSGGDSSFDRLKNTFNNAYTPMDWATSAGFDQRGNTFRHPNSQSGSFSASVKRDEYGVLRINALSPNDPLYTAGQGAHDAFSTFCTLVHGGDINAALKDAGDNLLAIGSASFNKAVQREHMQKQSEQQQQQKSGKEPSQTRDQPVFTGDTDISNEPDFPPIGDQEPNTQADKKQKTPFSISVFSLSGKSEEMKTKMLADRFVLDRIAILGQITTIYAKPNTGKTLLTLWMLIESLKTGRINGKSVFYINADDDYKGLVYKTCLAEQYGFEMLSPGHNGFESIALQGYMRQMIDDDTARGTVIILDTLKKFTDLMNKKAGSEFMARAREFVAHGGTLITLAHTNKNRGIDGKCVFGGTSDVSDDSDCVYILDEIDKTPTTKQVLFENTKSRGDVTTELVFSYSCEDGKSYQHRLDSIQMATQSQVFAAKIEHEASQKMRNDQPVIDAITEAIERGCILKTDLIKSAHEVSGISKTKLNKAISDYTRQGLADDSGLWREVTGLNNAKSYHLTRKTSSTAEDYLRAKNGE